METVERIKIDKKIVINNIIDDFQKNVWIFKNYIITFKRMEQN